MKIAIVGAGVAGVAAAFAAARAGHAVSLLHAGAGSSALYSGAIDLALWELAPEHEHLTTEVLEFGKALGWAISSERSAKVATREGLVRGARGRDSALLDLLPLKGKRVGVVDLDRDDWDARLLAAALNASPWAAAAGARFDPIRVAGLQSGAERRISSYDFAKLHDSPERASFFRAALTQAADGVGAWLTGPWLGIEQHVAARLATELHLPIGETLSGPGGPAGARFELARGKLLKRLGVEEQSTRVLAITPAAGSWRLDLDGDGSSLSADAVVLALGGVAAGGVRLKGSLAGSPDRGLALSLAAPVVFELDGRPFEVSSLFAVDFSASGLGALERLGVSVDESLGIRGARGLYAAGDLVSGQPRTVLAAVIQGLRAAQAAVSRG